MSTKPGLLLQRPSLDIPEDIYIAEEDEEDISQDLPSFKSVIFKGDQAKNENSSSLFYDAEKGQYVNLDNFAFADHANHFADDKNSETSSSLALLDSRILDETSTGLDDSKLIVDELKRNIEESSSSQPNSLDVSFDDAKPKIKSPREKTPPKRKTSHSLRKLSSESQRLPSKSSEDSSSTCHNAKYTKKKPKPVTKAAVPVQKRLNLDKNWRKLGQNKSHSATNLHKLSVKDYHESFQRRRLSSSSAPGQEEGDPNSSYDSLFNLSLKDLAGKKADYSHVQSKVRQYIYGGSHSRPSSKMQRRADDDLYGKSFVLSPGRKSLSMSNIVVQDELNYMSSRRTSCKSELKSFLSAKHLDDLHVSVKSSCRSGTQSRESLFRNDQVSRLLDDLSDPENIPPDNDEVVVEVEDLLQLAMDERRGKLEAIKVLAELKENYDNLQQKFAAAETTIDKLSDTNEPSGFGGGSSPSEETGVEEICLNNEHSMEKPTSLSTLHHQLAEIHEQLYGLEILSSNGSSFSSLDKKATLAKLRASFNYIQDRNSMATKHGANAEYLRLFNEVGEKLCLMELQDDEDEHDYETFAKAVPKEDNNVELDPLEKVAHWQQKAPSTNIPSGYGSISTSPQPAVTNHAKKAVSSERSSFEQGSPGDLDSGCPGSERSPSTIFQNNLVMTRNLSHVEEVPSWSTSKNSSSEHEQEEQLNKDSSKNSTLVLDPTLATANSTTPRGAFNISKQEIENEIDALRNYWAEHREEMMVLYGDHAPLKKPMTSTGCSPVIFDSQRSPKRSAKRRSSSHRRNKVVSDSEESRDVQEERRQEFEKFRNQKKQKRKSPQFAIGQPISNENLKISALFPKVQENQQEGRHVPTFDGDQVFIPKLSLEDQWSMEDMVKSLEASVEDKSCQVDVSVKRTRKKKHKDISSFLETLQSANEMAAQLKLRSESLLRELQSEMDEHLS